MRQDLFYFLKSNTFVLAHLLNAVTHFDCLIVGYAEELDKLRQQRDDIKGDLADQQDAILNLTQQRDEFQIEVRRLEYRIQTFVSYFKMFAPSSCMPPE